MAYAVTRIGAGLRGELSFLRRFFALRWVVIPVEWTADEAGVVRRVHQEVEGRCVTRCTT
jgi:hypothetical protein